MKRALGAVLLTLVTGCGGSASSDGGSDLAPARDLAVPGDFAAPPDLAVADDLAMAPDLAVARDLAKATLDMSPLAAKRCRTQSDCQNADRCLFPGEHPGCGICLRPPETCNSDAECKAKDAKAICDPLQCACNGGDKTCRTGCLADGDCAPWQFCAPTNRCVNDVCLKDKDCPVNFVCTPPNNPHCERKPCKDDGVCVGNCVKGLCYDVPGTCTPPVA